ncbi:MAG: CPBP family intramembrane metalloprotease [Planctomycetes bacterium]|nr:CPBP family intramembrane metalloprotease [Planctomycetota bacterium]
MKELRDLARDRKVFYAAILLPALIFPILLALTGKLTPEGPTTGIGLRIGLIGHGPEVDEIIRESPWANWATGADDDRIRSGELDAALIADYSGKRLTNFRVLYDKSSPLSELAARELRGVIERVRDRSRRNALDATGIDASSLPPRGVQYHDLANYVRTDPPTSPQFLPSMIMLMMLAAAAFAAIDLFPGERERGTLETLLVQPIRAEEALLGKYVAVFLVGYVAVIANIGGIAVASTFEASPLEIPLDASTIAGAILLTLPASALVAAILVRVAARAKTVREAQHYLLPLTLLNMVPALLAAAPEMQFDAFTACLPMAGPALALRELALGSFDPLAIAMMVVTTMLYCALVLQGALKYLANEEALLGDGDSDGKAARVIAVALFAILATFVVGPLLREAPTVVSILVPLVVFTALPAIVAGKSVGLGFDLRVFGRRTRGRSWIVAILTGIGLALVVSGVAALQRHLLAPPASFDEAGRNLIVSIPSLPVALLTLAIVPAIAEELLYRRFVLHGLRTELDRPRAILASAALFALHHLSVFRMIPSFVAGIVLGRLVLRTHRFWLAPVAHATSNAIMILLAHSASPLAGGSIARTFGDERLAVWRLLLGIVILVVTPWILERRQVWPLGRTAAIPDRT